MIWILENKSTFQTKLQDILMNKVIITFASNRLPFTYFITFTHYPYGIHIFSSLKISNKNILKNILEIKDQNRISI